MLREYKNVAHEFYIRSVDETWIHCLFGEYQLKKQTAETKVNLNLNFYGDT